MHDRRFGQAGERPTGNPASPPHRLQSCRGSRELRRERAISLCWLRRLESPAWDNAYNHATGLVRAGDLMVSWLAHDQIHLRQVANLRVLWLAQHAAPYSTRYAMP